jgi:hypothetical protein
MAVLYMLFALTLLIELVYFIRSEVSERLKLMKSAELAIALAVTERGERKVEVDEVG